MSGVRTLKIHMTRTMEKYGFTVLRELSNEMWPQMDCLHLISDKPIREESLLQGSWWTDVTAFLKRRSFLQSDPESPPMRIILDMNFIEITDEETFNETVGSVRDLVQVFIHHGDGYQAPISR